MRTLLKVAALAAAVALSLTLLPMAAFAQAVAAAPDTTVSAPWGDWVATALVDGVGLLSVVIMGVLTRFLPTTLRAYLTAQRTAQVEQLLERALGFAAQKVAGMVKGKTVDIDVHSELLERALQYAIDHGPQKLIDWMGGADGIEEKILARIPTSPSVASVTMTPAQAAP